MKIITKSKVNIDEIVAALTNGAVLVCPTDTVYGLVCDAANEKAVEKIFLIKKRDKTKPLLVFIDSIVEAKKIAEINADQEKILNEKWPGQVTFVFNAKNGLSSHVYENGTIGIRVPNYDLLNLILSKFNKPLAQTSANISNLPASTEIKEMIKQFENSDITPDIIINAGDLPKSKPSTIIDLTNNKINVLRK